MSSVPAFICVNVTVSFALRQHLNVAEQPVFTARSVDVYEPILQAHSTPRQTVRVKHYAAMSKRFRGDKLLANISRKSRLRGLDFCYGRVDAAIMAEGTPLDVIKRLGLAALDRIALLVGVVDDSPPTYEDGDVRPIRMHKANHGMFVHQANATGDAPDNPSLVQGTNGTSAERLATRDAQVDGSQKAIARGGTKGTTAAADVTSTDLGADRQGLDVAVKESALPTGAAKETLQITGNTSSASIDAKTPELWFGRTSDGGVAIRDRRRIVSAPCTNSINAWKAVTTTGGTFSHNSSTLTGQLVVDGTSGASVFARSIQTFYVTSDRVEAEVAFRFASSHPNLVQEIGILASDVPLLGALLAENNGTYTINVYDDGLFVAALPATVPYALDQAFHVFSMQTQGAKNANGVARFFVDGHLVAETVPAATGLPPRPMRGFDIAARVRCTGAAVSSTMLLGDGVAYSFTADAYPSIILTASRTTPVAIAAAWHPLVAVRSSKLGASARPTLWPTAARLFYSAGGASTGRIAVFHNRTGTTRLTGGSWTRDSDQLFDYNISAAAFDATGLPPLGGEIPITTSGEGTLANLDLSAIFRIGGAALCNWPDVSGSYEEVVFSAFETSGSLTIDSASLLVTQPGSGP